MNVVTMNILPCGLLGAAILLGGCKSDPVNPLAKPSQADDRALVATISPSFYYRGKGTPAEFITNTLGAGQPKKAIYLLMPERFSREYIDFDYSREGARKIIAGYIKDAERGFSWPEKKRETVIPATAVKPVIDGNIGTGEWSSAQVFKGEIPLDAAGVAPSGNTLWRVMYDREYLYFCAEVVDRDIRCDVAKFLFNGDSLEIFVLPDKEMQTYWEVILAPDGREFIAWHMVNPFGGHNSRNNIRPEKLQTAIKRTSDGFAVEAAIPFSALPTLGKSLPAAGATVYFMMVRTNRDGDHYSRSAPVPLLYDGHNIFGYIRGTLQ